MAQRISDETRERIDRTWQDILASVAAGELVKDVIALAGVSRTMLRVYLSESAPRRAEWQEAREQAADAFMDMALEEAMSNKSQDEAAHTRTRIDTLKWAARIRNPRLYGEKAQLDVNVRTVDLTRIIEAANARIAGQRAPLVLENQAPGLLELAGPAMRALADLL